MVTVVCTGGEAPPEHLCALWFDLADRRLAADAGLSLLRRSGRTADLWIGDGDSLDGDWEDWAAWTREVRRLDQAKDDSDTDAAVSSVETGEVWLVGGGGGRMDHWWSNLRLFGTRPRLTRWLTRWETGRRLSAGRSLDVPPGTVSVFPLGHGPWAVRSEGLGWPLTAVDFSAWHSLSNYARAGARLEATQGEFLVLQPHQAADDR